MAEKTKQLNERKYLSASAQVELVRSQLNLANRLALNRVETAAALGLRNPITVDRLVSRGLLHPSRASRRPLFPITEINRFLAETS